MKTSTILKVAGLCFIIGCSRQDSSTATTTATSKTSLLIQKDWVITSSQYKSASATTWTDQYALMAACDRDDHIVFRADGTYEVNEDATKCNAGNPFIVETGTWKLARNETTLVLTSVSGNTTINKDVTVDELDGTTLSYTYVKAKVGVNCTIKESCAH